MAVNDENNGYDLAEIERWLFNYFTVGMGPEVGGLPCLGSDPPDMTHLFWSMVRHFGNDVRPIIMRYDNYWEMQ